MTAAASQYRSHYGGELGRAQDAFEILAQTSNVYKCTSGVGTCLQAETMGDAMRGILNVASLIPGIDTFADVALCADAAIIRQDKVETGFNCGAVLVVGAGAGYTKAARESVDLAVDITGIAPTNAADGKPFAMGNSDYLDDFASQHGATTWRQLDDTNNWKPGVLDNCLTQTSGYFLTSMGLQSNRD